MKCRKEVSNATFVAKFVHHESLVDDSFSSFHIAHTNGLEMMSKGHVDYYDEVKRRSRIVAFTINSNRSSVNVTAFVLCFLDCTCLIIASNLVVDGNIAVIGIFVRISVR